MTILKSISSGDAASGEEFASELDERQHTLKEATIENQIRLPTTKWVSRIKFMKWKSTLEIQNKAHHFIWTLLSAQR
tara:strand:+ start:343 stop:573 length:231 start_codon:yes stop_codon:yes gene_type:complete